MTINKLFKLVKSLEFAIFYLPIPFQSLLTATPTQSTIQKIDKLGSNCSKF